MKPILKWVGGKSWMTPYVSPFVHKYLKGTYYEPFVGGGAILFDVKPKHAVIVDSVEALTQTYRIIKNKDNLINGYLSVCRDYNSEKDYYMRRLRFNHLLDRGQYDDEFAALFIFLNKAGYNGLWRQNKHGQYNVPYGQYKTLKLPTRQELNDASHILQSAEIHTTTSQNETFRIIDESTRGDVVFADPPYLTTYDNYDGILQSTEDFHRQLAVTLQRAAQRGVTVLATNIDLPIIHKWYGAFCTIRTYTRSQTIAGTNQGRKGWSQLFAICTPKN